MARGQDTATNLQDLVTGILAPDVEEEKTADDSSLVERIKMQKHTPFEILSKGRELEKVLLSADPKKDEVEIRDRVVDWASVITAQRGSSRSRLHRPVLSSVGSYVPSSGEILFMLHDYLRQPTQENLDSLYRFVLSYNDSQELQRLQSNFTQTLSYLEERWGDDTVENIHEITGASKPTVKKWIAGSDPSSGNGSRIKMVLELIFCLETACGMSASQREEWLHEKRSSLGGTSAWDMIVATSSRWSMPTELGTLLDQEINKSYSNFSSNEES